MERIRWWASFQPIDLLLCRPGAWGCRFLNVTHRLIVPKVWDTATFVALRAGANIDEKHRASFEAASLPQRTLRFADLSESELFAADLTGADLTGAHLIHANLSGAGLTSADLTGAYLLAANLTGAYLLAANLTGAYLLQADLNGAHLGEAHLNGAYLLQAHLNGADLTGAHLNGAKNLIPSQLDEVCGTGTKLPSGRTLNKPCPSPVK
jgi:uncharacterized protein YjbI with pentapeptide repeats